MLNFSILSMDMFAGKYMKVWREVELVMQQQKNWILSTVLPRILTVMVDEYMRLHYYQSFKGNLMNQQVMVYPFKFDNLI